MVLLHSRLVQLRVAAIIWAALDCCYNQEATPGSPRIARSPVLLFRPDPGRFDDRPPFFNLSFLLRSEPIRRLFGARPGLLAELNEPLMHGRVGQAFDHSAIKFGNDVCRRCFWRPQAMPKGRVETCYAFRRLSAYRAPPPIAPWPSRRKPLT